MASPSLLDNFAATVELYSTLIKKKKAENPQLNVSEVSFARGKGGKNSYGKRYSTGISNVSNTAVDDRFFEKHEYNDLAPDQKNMLRLKRIKRGHVGKSHSGTGNNNGKNKGKRATIKSITRSIAALRTNIGKFSLPDYDDDEDESSDEEEGTTNRSNAALTQQNKKKKHGNNSNANLSAFTMRLGYVGRVEELNRSDLDSHADCCVCGKEVLIFNDFDGEVTFTGWEPEG
jgi:hypothetical protein